MQEESDIKGIYPHIEGIKHFIEMKKQQGLFKDSQTLEDYLDDVLQVVKFEIFKPLINRSTQ
jgi:hypothetical protein